MTYPKNHRRGGRKKIRVHIPIKTVSEANTREHWAIKAKRKQGQKTAVAYFMREWIDLDLRKLKRCRVTFTRIGKRKLDSDNLQSSFKAIRDQVATMIGVDDGSDWYEFRYEQQIGKEYGVVIEIGKGEAK